MVDIQFHPIAREDIKEIFDYLSRDSIQYADSFIDGLFEKIELLKDFPKMGKKYPDKEPFRQIIYQNYRILYTYKEEKEKIIIMIILHCARNLKL